MFSLGLWLGNGLPAPMNAVAISHHPHIPHPLTRPSPTALLGPN